MIDLLKNIRLLVIIVICVFTILPVVVYIISFGSNGISDKSNNWANLSTFISGFLTLANLIIFSILTVSIQEYTLKKDTESKRIAKIINRPLLSFVKESENAFYSIENIGNGSALNIVLRGHFHQHKWQQAYLFYSLVSGSTKPLKWTKGCNKLMANYSDVFGNEFISFMDGDTLRVIDCKDEKSIKDFAKEYQWAQSDSVKPTWP